MPNSEIRTFDVVVIGAGAAGMMCAIEAGKRGRKVLLLEKSDKAGKKILISGGGRCNFTNLFAAPDRYVSDNKHFCKSALRNYSQNDFIALVEKYGIPYHEKKLGQLFCDKSATSITDLLLAECDAADVTLWCDTGADAISKTADDLFEVTAASQQIHAKSVVIASGGLSIPKMGANDLALNDFSRALTLQPNNSEALLARGLIHFDNHNLRAARADWQALINANPDIASRQQAEKYLQRLRPKP
ncbi:MAG: FAD-dependent oxidoreductase [Magnetovibrio sp.]|nr:FAD-dependent oxidoreductase [Magnetovibrio sp.]